jgi:UDP-N-acetylglucosamine 2-epimerase (non-hydrolysing)
VTFTRIGIIYGTRPEAIKVAPLIKALKTVENVNVTAISTQQHESLLSTALSSAGFSTDFEIAEPDRSSVQSLVSTIGLGLETPLANCDLVVVQGDTVSAFAGALAGFLQKIPVIHLEAGLRTSELLQPHPEEGLRRAITHLASLHLAPTEHAKRNLEREGVPPNTIFVTGNTSIDAIKFHLDRTDSTGIAAYVNQPNYCVLTVHRRENWGEGLDRIARALLELALKFPEVDFICPLHPNPLVRRSFESLPNLDNLRILEPFAHNDFVELLKGSQLILTDSGGIQEESTVLGVPVVILRDETERPEVVESGWGVIAGTDETTIVRLASELLTQRLTGEFNSPVGSPFGEGNAGTNSAETIQNYFQIR